MQNPPNTPGKDRRVAVRHPPRTGVRVLLRASATRGAPAFGAGLLDVSDSGARVLLRTPLPMGLQIDAEFWGPSTVQPVRVVADVAWCVATTAREFQAGLRFRQYLSLQDLQTLGR